MFKTVLLALALSLPHLIGLATWYGPPGVYEGSVMRNGEPFRLDAPTMAVDVSRVDLIGKEAWVWTDECRGLYKVTITDTGMLGEAGKVRFGVGPLNRARYWPVDRADVKWADGAVEMPFVADFPRDFYAEMACEADWQGQGDTMVVMIWVIPMEKD